MGLIVVALSTGITAWQAVLTRQEIQVITGQQRAWLRLEPKFEVGLGILDSGAWTGIRLNVSNIGTMPAHKTWAFVRLYAHPIDNSADWPIPEICPEKQRYELGQTILPGETGEVFINPVLPGRAELDTWERDEKIDFYLVVCVQYETANEPTVRQTGSAWLVKKKQPDGYGEPFNSRMSLTQPEDIYVDRLGFTDQVD